MNIVRQAEGSCDISVDGELTIYRAAEFHAMLNEVNEKYITINLDMEDVSEIDTACFQVLLHHKLKCLEKNKKFIIHNCSESVLELFRIFGVGGIFANG